MSASKMIAFRVQNIPLQWSWKELTRAIAASTDDADASITTITGTLLPAPDASLRTQVAVIQFSNAVPLFLEPVKNDKTSEKTAHLRANGTDLRFDKNFWGMTPLIDPGPEEDVSMDIVAVTGLDGNAYGSWASRDVNAIWLRDYLKEDIPKCRVLTFGYNTKLTIDNNYCFEDFCKELLSQLRLARSSHTTLYRPLVLVGHSYGCRVIAQSLCRCKRLDDPDLDAILTATCAVVFFGAVHRGMDTSDIEDYLRDVFPDQTARRKIVQQLRVDNDVALRELQNFIDICPRFLVISIYERRQSRKLVRRETASGSSSSASENSTPTTAEKTWKRDGDPYTPTTEHSQLLGLPTAWEISIPSDADHSGIAKFSYPSDSVYRELILHLERVQAEVDLSAFPYMPLLRAKPIGGPRLGPHHEPDPRSYQQFVTTANRWLDGREPQSQTSMEPDLQTINRQGDIKMSLHPAFTLLRAAASCIRELISDRIFSDTEFQLLDKADEVTRTARYHLTIIDKARNRIYLEGDRRRQARTVMLKLRGLLVELIRALDLAFSQSDPGPGSAEPRCAVLPPITVKTLMILIPAFGNLNIVPGMKAEKMASMATAWNRDGDARGGASVEWVPFEWLHFPVGAVPEDARDSEGWVQKVVRLFTREEAKALRLRARRFGVLSREGRLEKVMVEFRPYPPSIRIGNQQANTAGGPPAAASDDYKARKWALTSLARMLLWSEADTQSPSARFPSVPFRCLADMAASSTPSFALVFSAEGLYALSEVIKRPSMRPSIAQRVQLVLSYARALAALHTAYIVHGGFNTDNLFLQFPDAEDDTRAAGARPVTEAKALLAGFETARSLGGTTDKIDVEDPDLRAYLHPDRLAQGSVKNTQQPAYDVFGLGMVMTEIGLWELLRCLPGYPQSWQSDGDRQRFCRAQRNRFVGDTTPENLGSLYAGVIAFCFGKGPDPLMGSDATASFKPSDDDSQAAWKTLRVVELIQECARLVCGSPTAGLSP
ncbi:uncharacterized protein B0I36DRAFT_366411 [Microdochium trichocladiopsis]|uniref:Protein kinase domain-containing protein n=1 Tax=Microdochium trichocladiopsis TaxID=1682393 RepID=A0A9P8XX57_9PEZI|nr:uncharacterized protein B0I36DRAFT_366411 [Microdochium trichocladiopsis]KAH7024466.1 hypothetical protein B0I36DRAFT_366411 [Microdochium trichocladiopsis]